MSTQLKTNLWWALFIGVSSALWCILYTAVESALALPSADYVLWMSFVSLALFFSVGDVKKIPGLCVCEIMGFLWAVLCLWIMGLMGGGNMATLVGVTVAVALCCAVHMGFAANTAIGYTHVVLGNFAMCFAVGGGNIITEGGANVLVIFISLIGGMLLGWFMVIQGGWSAKLAGAKPDADKEVAK